MLSPHGRRVRAQVRAAASVTSLRVLDPRTTPVVISALVRIGTAPVDYRLVLTLFCLPAGTWVVDDLVTLDG